MREALLPSFYKSMVFKEQVIQLITECLSEKPSLFLIDVSISDTYKIIVFIDGDNGVTLQDCIDVTIFIESKLDREVQDYALEVASVGVGSALKLVRQYKKNIGRNLIVKTNETTIEAELIAADDDKIVLKWEAREQKKIGKGKETVLKNQEIPYNEIKQAVVTVNFN